MKYHEVKIEFLEKPKHGKVAAEITFSNGTVVARKITMNKWIWHCRVDGRHYVFLPNQGIVECFNISDGDPLPTGRNLLESSLRIA